MGTDRCSQRINASNMLKSLTKLPYPMEAFEYFLSRHDIQSARELLQGNETKIERNLVEPGRISTAYKIIIKEESEKLCREERMEKEKISSLIKSIVMTENDKKDIIY